MLIFKILTVTDCSPIHTSLENMVDDGDKMLPDSSMCTINKQLMEQGLEPSANLDIKWRLPCGEMAFNEIRAFISEAVAIFHVHH